MENNFIQILFNTIHRKWNCIAIYEFPGKKVYYRDIVYNIASFQRILQSLCASKGSKITICANNSANWICLYFAIVSSGYVAVIIPANLSHKDIEGCIKFSDSNYIFLEKEMFSAIGRDICDKYIFNIESFELISAKGYSKGDILNFNLEYLYKKHNTYKKLALHLLDPDEVCTIMYTSGSTDTPKGVMLSESNISSNLHCFYECDYARGEKCHINAVLPFYHIFGLLVDALLPICFGIRIAILKMPRTAENISAMSLKYKPTYFLTIPIIIEQLIKYHIGEDISRICNVAEDNSEQFKYLGKKLKKKLGGNFNLFYTGGAAIPIKTIELLGKLQVPIIIGYGTTECGFITIGAPAASHSSGRVYKSINLKSNSINKDGTPGEILIKGNNVFKGYYKNIPATKAAFTYDGWFRTGDMGFVNKEGYLFITGRCKDMLLTSNGENIYPEDIEVVMNASPYIKESILVQRGEKFYAILVPDREKADVDQLDSEALNKKIDEAVREASKKIPGFTIISGFELRDEPLERTPKGSIKRFLYS